MRDRQKVDVPCLVPLGVGVVEVRYRKSTEKENVKYKKYRCVVLIWNSGIVSYCQMWNCEAIIQAANGKSRGTRYFQPFARDNQHSLQLRKFNVRFLSILEREILQLFVHTFQRAVLPQRCGLLNSQTPGKWTSKVQHTCLPCVWSPLYVHSPNK